MAEVSTSRARDTDRKTRIHLSFYDRTKFITLFILVFFILVWAEMSGNPILGFTDAVQNSAESRWWIFPLLAIELIRQTHF